ncbi:hypothetical protein ACFCX0_27745 [Streptomyces sp. NPDC056352]|uniref:hypothetical protein n=1 Tax=Streptomyces sp. NPDC056352 TaxID=3345791 RepID=UPI0035DFF569
MHLPGRGSSRLDVSADTLRRRVGGGTLQAERDELGRRMIHGQEPASAARELHRAERTNNGSSARHRLAGIVTDVISEMCRRGWRSSPGRSEWCPSSAGTRLRN